MISQSKLKRDVPDNCARVDMVAAVGLHVLALHLDGSSLAPPLIEGSNMVILHVMAPARAANSRNTAADAALITSPSRELTDCMIRVHRAVQPALTRRRWMVVIRYRLLVIISRGLEPGNQAPCLGSLPRQSPETASKGSLGYLPVVSRKHQVGFAKIRRLLAGQKVLQEHPDQAKGMRTILLGKE